MFLTLTLFLQLGQGLAAVFAGMVTIPFALMMALSSFYSGRVVERYGRGLVVTGLAIVFVGFGLVLGWMKRYTLPVKYPRFIGTKDREAANNARARSAA